MTTGKMWRNKHKETLKERLELKSTKARVKHKLRPTKKPTKPLYKQKENAKLYNMTVDSLNEIRTHPAYKIK